MLVRIFVFIISLAYVCRRKRIDCDIVDTILLLCVYVCLGNKIDKPEIRQVTYDEGSAFAQENGLLFMEASAKTNVGIAQLFQETIRKVLDDVNLVSTTVPVRLGQRSFISSGCC